MHTNNYRDSGGGTANMAALLRGINPPKTDALNETSDPSAYANALSIVTHDLKGPLANLSLLIESIEDSAEAGSRTARNAAKADVIISQLSKMLSAVLERAREGRDPLSCRQDRVNLIDVLELAMSVNQPRARQRGITFESCALTPVTVSGDQDLLFEAIDNLIGNAVRHSFSNSKIKCEVGIEEDGTAYLRVDDEGPGFQEGDLHRAFRPFTRLSARARNGEESSGLGLWITRLIAERHGGRVEASNRPTGQGASMTLWIPAQRPDAQDRRQEPSRPNACGLKRYQVGPKQKLIQPPMAG
ncbi:HAMP domain-containing histidine kinase [Cohaesibacter sp. CAU 1516]|uniref:sensor histidine kinase n=1 Tax=Cohaesibacter sp. CAU 1516 TaxID=2576038 RepID=UPI0010FD5EA3|nr:HAMP domain-containing sensor histidine kinase [Cohaesibacter sp. CAU 1516]TLP46073.1 HAMP domain-containing histidine kinase [Cohaesibacter sp. CAU 1516]